MLFNTLEYFFFFIFVFTVAWVTAGHSRFRILFLLVASLYFYASNNGWQTCLLLLTTTIDYLVCLGLAKTGNEKKRRYLLLISVVSNIGMLCYFKYANFFADSLIKIAASMDIQLSWVTLNVALPLGISFYTFEALSYTIDVYRREIPVERDWSRLAFLVTFFPHLIAGPIIRAADFFPQMNQRTTVSHVEFERAIFLIACGLVKKVVLADQLSFFADAAFNDPAAVGTMRTWFGIYAFAFQIYFDFSGYSDIAIGCAKLLGFTLPDNFRRPYAATSITDFWRRWHISLSSWLRDYLYIPLGGNRMPTKAGVYRNLMLTMLLGGLWHGAAWTFVLWGAIHGFYLSVERALGIGRTMSGDNSSLLVRLVVILLTFHLILLCWILFRAESLERIGQMLKVMFAYNSGPQPTAGLVLFGAVMLFAWLWQLVRDRWEVTNYWINRPLPVKAITYAATGVLVLVIGSDVPKSFIYFRF